MTMGIPKSKYQMDYINDPDVYKAVMFACRMIREGKSVPIACRIAAYYYDVDQNDVNKYVSQRGGEKPPLMERV